MTVLMNIAVSGMVVDLNEYLTKFGNAPSQPRLDWSWSGERAFRERVEAELARLVQSPDFGLSEPVETLINITLNRSALSWGVEVQEEVSF